ncbi:MAG TPA: DUF1993 domain-containing protein [Xanthomonadaceae bacterium]|jgi:hypothetical protein|nr:DUF1993 domain-containing protein [Xanthomonadaceae bacterium]
MHIAIFEAVVTIPLRMLHNLDKIIDKAAADIAAGKLDEETVLRAKLAPDMFDFTRQVQLATDFAKSPAARLAGVEVPKFPDEETTLAALKTRIAGIAEFLKGFKPDQFDGAAQRQIVIPMRDRTLDLVGQDYLLGFAQPNFYFHYSTAYALLRHLGVEIGKRDFIGQ